VFLCRMCSWPGQTRCANEAARVHQAAPRRGGVAIRGARAAVPVIGFLSSLRATPAVNRRCVLPRPRGRGLFRRPQRRTRVPLGCGPVRAIAGAGGRPCQATSRGDRGHQHPFGAGGQACDQDDPYRHGGGFRSLGVRAGRKPCAVPHDLRGGGEVAGAAQEGVPTVSRVAVLWNPDNRQGSGQDLPPP
jgi:hypothetical protein